MTDTTTRVTLVAAACGGSPAQPGAALTIRLLLTSVHSPAWVSARRNNAASELSSLLWPPHERANFFVDVDTDETWSNRSKIAVYPL